MLNAQPVGFCRSSEGCHRLGLILDEVSGDEFCVGHAGPLAWTDREVDRYSMSLLSAGVKDVRKVA